MVNRSKRFTVRVCGQLLEKVEGYLDKGFTQSELFRQALLRLPDLKETTPVAVPLEPSVPRQEPPTPLSDNQKSRTRTEALKHLQNW